MSGKTASDKAIFNMRWEIDGCMTILIHLMKPYLKMTKNRNERKKTTEEWDSWLKDYATLQSDMTECRPIYNTICETKITFY